MKIKLMAALCVFQAGRGLARIGDSGFFQHIDAVPSWQCGGCTESAEERPLFSAPYTPPVWRRLPSYTPHGVAWQDAFSLQQAQGQWSIHFLLDTVDVIDSTGGIGVSVFCASGKKKAAGGYDVRIDIDQTKEQAFLNVFDSAGNRLAGSPPRIEQTPAPFLPWRDGMRQFYSVLVEQRGQQCNLLLIQHTFATIPVYPEPVAAMLRLYAGHECLYGRPHAYLDRPEHMRCLPLPLSHEAYASLLAGDGIFLALATRTGIIEVRAAS